VRIKLIEELRYAFVISAQAEE